MAGINQQDEIVSLFQIMSYCSSSRMSGQEAMRETWGNTAFGLALSSLSSLQLLCIQGIPVQGGAGYPG